MSLPCVSVCVCVCVCGVCACVSVECMCSMCCVMQICGHASLPLNCFHLLGRRMNTFYSGSLTFEQS